MPSTDAFRPSDLQVPLRSLHRSPRSGCRRPRSSPGRPAPERWQAAMRGLPVSRSNVEPCFGTLDRLRSYVDLALVERSSARASRSSSTARNPPRPGSPRRTGDGRSRRGGPRPRGCRSRCTERTRAMSVHPRQFLLDRVAHAVADLGDGDALEHLVEEPGVVAEVGAVPITPVRSKSSSG